MEGLSSKLGRQLRFLSWPTALIAILVARAVAAFAAKPGSSLLSYGGVSHFLGLLMTTGFIQPNRAVG
jgi:hypothetical protein